MTSSFLRTNDAETKSTPCSIPKKEVGGILLADIRHVEAYVGDVDSLVSRYLAADLDLCDHIGVGQPGYSERDSSVVDEDHIAFLELRRKGLVCHGDFLFASFDIARGENEGLTFLQGCTASDNLAESYLGSLRIEHYRGWNTETVSYATEGLYVFAWSSWLPVRKIEARDVHARKKHFAENVFAV